MSMVSFITSPYCYCTFKCTNGKATSSFKKGSQSVWCKVCAVILAGLGTIEFSVHYEKQHSQLQVTIECAKVSLMIKRLNINEH